MQDFDQDQTGLGFSEATHVYLILGQNMATHVAPLCKIAKYVATLQCPKSNRIESYVNI